MSRHIAIGALLLCLGCKSTLFPGHDACAPPAGTVCGPVEGAPCAPPPQPCAPPPQPCAAPRAAPRAAEAPRSQTTRETETHAAGAAVAQDILLVPRTVYVPYAAQTPVAPARMSALVPGAAVTTRTIERTEATSAAAETRSAATDTRSSELPASDILQALRALNQRLDNLERARAAPAPPCPAPAPPCPGGPFVAPVLPGPEVPAPVPAGTDPAGRGCPLPPLP